jgi:hypothetical protein
MSCRPSPDKFGSTRSFNAASDAVNPNSYSASPIYRCLPKGSQPESSTQKKPEKLRLESKQFPLQISIEERVRSALYDLCNPKFPENLKSNGCI